MRGLLLPILAAGVILAVVFVRRYKAKRVREIVLKVYRVALSARRKGNFEMYFYCDKLVGWKVRYLANRKLKRFGRPYMRVVREVNLFHNVAGAALHVDNLFGHRCRHSS